MNESILKLLEQHQTMTPKQQKIVEAAITLIAEQGYANTSTNEIAKRAGVAEGTIFRHYKTKQALLFSIVDPVTIGLFAPLIAEKFIEQVFDQDYPHFEDFIYTFIENRFYFVQANLPLIKICLQEIAFQPEIQEDFKQVFLKKIRPAMYRNLDYFKDRGELMQLDNEQLIRMIASAVLGYFMTRFIIQPTKAWDDEKEIKQTVTFILEGLKNKKGS